MLTQAILKKVFPKAKTPKKLFDAMDELFPKYSVDTPHGNGSLKIDHI
jgi:hypothetical protein